MASYSGANLSSDEIGYNHHEARERLRCKALDDMLLPLRMTGREGKAEAEAQALGASEPAIEERRQQVCKIHAKEKLAQQLATLPNMRLSLNEKGAFGSAAIREALEHITWEEIEQMTHEAFVVLFLSTAVIGGLSSHEGSSIKQMQEELRVKIIIMQNKKEQQNPGDHGSYTTVLIHDASRRPEKKDAAKARLKTFEQESVAGYEARDPRGNKRYGPYSDQGGSSSGSNKRYRW